MMTKCFQGRNIPWGELNSLISGTEWWVKIINRMEVNLGKKIDKSTKDLAMMASFNCCWYHTDFPTNILKTCEAIGTGKPKAGRSCCHVSPERWQNANEYVIAIQGKLKGITPKSLADEKNCNLKNISRIYSMMGEKLSDKTKLLFKHYLFVLINRLKWATNFHILGDESSDDPGLLFRDFDYEYLFENKIHYSDLTLNSPQIKNLDLEIVQNISDGKEWLARLNKDEQPLCHQKFLRYQDIKISSIGCGKWRGALLPYTMTKEWYQKEFEIYENVLKAWCAGKVIKGSHVYEMVNSRLGDPTPETVEIVKNCLLQPSRFYEHFYWLKDLDRPIDQQKRGY
jgi:hypothetical protein